MRWHFVSRTKWWILIDPNYVAQEMQFRPKFIHLNVNVITLLNQVQLKLNSIFYSIAICSVNNSFHVFLWEKINQQRYFESFDVMTIPANFVLIQLNTVMLCVDLILIQASLAQSNDVVFLYRHSRQTCFAFTVLSFSKNRYNTTHMQNDGISTNSPTSPEKIYIWHAWVTHIMAMQ